MQLSAIIITKNEEKMIDACLESLMFCDEIIVIDSGSIDDTKKICEKYTDKIYSLNSNIFPHESSLLFFTVLV